MGAKQTTFLNAFKEAFAQRFDIVPTWISSCKWVGKRVSAAFTAVFCLTSEASDPKSGTAEFKATAIRIEKLNDHAAREPAIAGE